MTFLVFFFFTSFRYLKKLVTRFDLRVVQHFPCGLYL
jgi:hypothetical protein